MGRLEINFNNGWRFFKGDVAKDEAAYPNFNDANWELVNLPHTPEIDKLRPRPPYHYIGTVWYRKRFTLNRTWKDKKIFIEFGAANTKTDVWVNGVHLLTHYGGYLPFIVDVTDYVTYGNKKNVIAVKVNNEPDPDTPIGNPTWFNWGGIYRDVTLRVTDKLHITDAVYENKPASGGIFVTYPHVDKKSATVLVKTHIRNEYDVEKTFTLKTTIIDKDNNVVVSTQNNYTLKALSDKQFSQTLIVQNPLLWHPNHPYLYTVISEILEAGKLVDVVRTRIGIRKIEFSHEGFKINGERLILMGVNRMQDYPYVGYAMPKSGQVRDAIKIKEAGFNFVRTSQYPPDPSFLDACDELGLMVMIPIPGFQYMGGELFRKRSYQDMRDLIRRDRNHPCVILWELSLNETYFDREYAQKAVEIGHEEYPGAYIAGWLYDDIYDVYLRNADHVPSAWEYKGRKPLVINEYGHWRYRLPISDEIFLSTSDVLRSDGEKRLLKQARNHQESLNKNRSLPFLCGDALWVFADYACYPQGIVDCYRYPKFSYYFYQSQRDPNIIFPNIDSGPMVYIANYWTHYFLADEIVVFSNCEQIKLYLNGRLIDTRSPDKDENSKYLAHPPFTFKNIPWEPGELKAEGLIGGKVVATHTVRTPGTPKRIKVWIDTTGCGSKVRGKNNLFVFAEVVDENGTLVNYYDGIIEFQVAGPCKLVSPNFIRSEAGIATAMIETYINPGWITVSAFSREDSLKGFAQLPVNEPPTPAPNLVVFPDTYRTRMGETLTVPAEQGVLFNDYINEKEELKVTLIKDVSHGTLTLNSDGSFIYTPERNKPDFNKMASGFKGKDTFIYKVDNGMCGHSSRHEATVTIIVYY